MSAGTAGPETLGSLSDEPEIQDPNSQKAKEISGKSPMQIALRRLVPRQGRRRLRVGRAVLRRLRGVRRSDLQRCSVSRSRPHWPASGSTASTTACPSPRWARPTVPSRGTTRWVSRPARVRTTSPTGSTAAASRSSSRPSRPLIASTVGDRDRPAGRLPRWHRRQGAVVLHRHVPDHPVPARRADAGPDPQRALQHLRQLLDDPEGQPGGGPLALRLDGHRPPDPRRGALPA